MYLSELAETKLLQLSEYLIHKWDLKTRDRFIQKLNNKIRQISHQPDSCPTSKEFNGLHKCVITKQTTIYYRVIEQKEEIEIITLFDTRQSPDKLNKDVG